MSNVIRLHDDAEQPVTAADIIRHFDGLHRSVRTAQTHLKACDVPPAVAAQIDLLMAQASLALFRANMLYLGEAEWSIRDVALPA